MGTADLRGRSFLRELDFTVAEYESLLTLASHLKLARSCRREVRRLDGLNIALIFEKPSTRTRCAFEVAAHHQGAQVTYLDPEGSHLGHKESAADSASVLGRLYDGIEYRGFDQHTVEALAEHAGVPVWNGLTDQWHPTQALCDVMTMREHVASTHTQIKVAYLGDARNNVANSLLVAGSMAGLDIRMVAPASLQSPDEVTSAARRIGHQTGAVMTLTDDIEEGVLGADFIYTDVWLSMGEPEDTWVERTQLLTPYQVTMDVLAKTRNPRAKFMHCLPALHNLDTDLAQRLYSSTGLTCLEVTDEVFTSAHSIVFDQAENRMHTIKAVMVATIGQVP